MIQACLLSRRIASHPTSDSPLPAPVCARALKQAKAHADANAGALPAGLDEVSLCSSMRLCILDDDADAARSAIACFDCLSRDSQVRDLLVL